MSVVSTGVYEGNLKLTLIHGPSGARITTAAPKDNMGDGSSFSPTDLLAAAVGSCVLSVIGIVAQRDNIDLKGAHFRVEKYMSESPRRVRQLNLDVHLPAGLDAPMRRKFEATGNTCPVKKSLSQAVNINLVYHYDV